MSSTAGLRVSQRRPQACQECSKKKLKCDKRVPCSRCTKAGLRCHREKVRISKSLSQNRGELAFLRRLETSLKAGGVDASMVAGVSRRIADLEYGDDDETDPVQSDDLANAEELPLPEPEQPLLVPNTESTSSQLGLSLNDAAKSSNDSWARHYGACYPHRACDCYQRRSHCEMTSINSNLGSKKWHPVNLGSIRASLPSIDNAKKLIHLHTEQILWHHNSIHAPTFLAQCERFWQENTSDHPLWVALYLSILSVTVWSSQNSISSQKLLGVEFDNGLASSLYQSMLDILYSERFTENFSLYSLQAIIISTRVSNNLGFADSTAILLAAATRIAHYMGLHKISDFPNPFMSNDDQWHDSLEREIGKRVWWQLTNQDYFSMHYTDTYIIHPDQFSTPLPKNCENHDLVERPFTQPTVSSYTIMMGHIAEFLARVHDDLGPMARRKPAQEQYLSILRADQTFRKLIQEKVPRYLVSHTLSPQDTPPWLGTARLTIAMSAADKIIMIHRPFLLPSFRNLAYARTRRTCVAAAKTILRHHERHAEEDRVSLWTHSAFAITAANVLGLELYHAATDDADADAIRDVLAKARERLSARKGDMLGKRSAELISAILEFDAERARTTRAGGDGGGWSEFFGQQQYVCGWFDFDAAAADVAGLDFVVGQEVPGLGDVVGGGSPLSLEEFEPWFTQAFGTVEAFL